MQTETSGRSAYPDEPTLGSSVGRPRARRVSTETKSAFKTTEFFVYVASVVAVLIASMTVGDDSGASAGGGGATGDYFRADRAWLFITILTVGYMLARGIAKSGSKDYYDDDAR